MSISKTRRRRVALLQRRLRHLDERITTRSEGYAGSSYDIAEAYALKWAIAVCTKAIDVGLIKDLEPNLHKDEL